MDDPNTIVIVGGVDNNQAKLQTQLEPTRLDELMGMAVTSIFHGEVFNVNETNNTIYYAVPVETHHAATPEIGKRIPTQAYEFKIPEGNYPTTASILKAISNGFKEIIWRKGRFRDRNSEPKLLLTMEQEGVILINPRHIIEIPTQGSDTPWGLAGVQQSFDAFVKYHTIKNVDFTQNLMPAFLYVNIVENSYINGKLSRLLSMIPISMKSDWSYHEFAHPNYVPIDVREFSKIQLEIRDIDGNLVKFDPRFKAIITLKTKPIKGPKSSL